MTKNFDLHDTISVVIPGAGAWFLIVYVNCATWKECVDIISKLSVGGAAIFLCLSFIAGELLQGMGKFILQCGILKPWVDDSYQKVVDSIGSSDVCQNILLPAKMKQLREYLQKELQMDHKKEAAEGNLFYIFKLKVYRNDVYRLECIKMLTKAHFFSTMMALFLVAFLCCGAVILLLAFAQQSPECAAQCRIMHYVCSHFEFVKCLIILFFWGGGIYGALKAYCMFNQYYAKCLFSAFLELVEEENAKKA